MIKLNKNSCERNKIVKVKLCVQTEVEKVDMVNDNIKGVYIL